jgi:hypothetical protein
MAARIPDSLERLTHADLIGVVRDLIGEVGRLRAENEKLGGALRKLKVEHQAVKDELARLKKLPPRPPQKPSGMDKTTDQGGSGGDKSPDGEKSSRRRGSQLDKLTIGATVIVTAKAPVGSRRKGYEDIVVQDLSVSPQVTLYRRERWETPEGERIIAALDPGIVGGYGPNLHRLVLALHFSGQVTCERIVALLNGMGVKISKRQVVRLLTVKLETFRAEDAAVLQAGLGGAYVTADDTGARHAGKSGYTTQIGSDSFTVFRTGPSKSRLAFLSRLCGSTAFYVINDAALDYMKDRQLPQAAIDKFADHKERIFSSPEAWERHLQALGPHLAPAIMSSRRWGRSPRAATMAPGIGAPVLKGIDESGSWKLWKTIAAKSEAFGNPSPFCDDIEGSKWYSFTATLKDPVFHDYMEEFSGNLSGTGGLVTLTDSNWLMSFVIWRQPHLPNQPRDVKIFWGYGLNPDRKGNFVGKTMAECTGREILDELWGHLKIQDLMTPFVDAGKVNCIPVAMPFIDSLFMPRKIGDRPDVLPEGATNFAFLGQFVEAPDDCVFTVEYSVRTAQMAVYGLFETSKDVIPVYDSIHQPKYLIQAAHAFSR